MPDGGSDPRLAPEVYGHDPAVTQGELYRPLTLLACHTTRDGAIDLVGQPILTSYSLELQDTI